MAEQPLHVVNINHSNSIAIETLEKAGRVINKDKSSDPPTQKMEFLDNPNFISDSCFLELRLY